MTDEHHRLEQIFRDSVASDTGYFCLAYFAVDADGQDVPVRHLTVDATLDLDTLIPKLREAFRDG